jgi:hypothetical protein
MPEGRMEDGMWTRAVRTPSCRGLHGLGSDGFHAHAVPNSVEDQQHRNQFFSVLFFNLLLFFPFLLFCNPRNGVHLLGFAKVVTGPTEGLGATMASVVTTPGALIVAVLPTLAVCSLAGLLLVAGPPVSVR